ncbi:alpha/beta fold hydrolase [Streptomyces sp. NPDC004539]|uniref:alpha/beta hydrolase n=1 Tax=Streptomyces sp. NPDC004539 TaxID=3154280 RepID=UPI0033AACBD9
MRPVKATAVAVSAVVAAGAASVAAGRMASDPALKAPPDRPLPTEPKLTVHRAAAGEVTLTRGLAALRPGTYGLTGAGVHAVCGPVLPNVPHSADTVVRRLERVSYGSLDPGTAVRLTPDLHVGDPTTALGLAHTGVEIPGELGALPAWFVPGARRTWVIAVHGLGAGRTHALNVLGFLHRRRFPVLVPAHRGDEDAPRSPDGLNHLGTTEWRDVDAAIRYALGHGADRVILLGWSTGAAMALRAATHSGLADRVSGLVLDSPALDWRTTVRSLATARHTPGALLPLAVRAALGRLGADGRDPDDALALPAVPTLVFHGPDDTVAPWDLSRRLVATAPALATLHEVRGAPHGAMWNADPAAYEEALRRFLTPLM